ncbi:MAG: hypothetical protein ACHQ4H_11565 [Ktedonobacterales bacterium]
MRWNDIMASDYGATTNSVTLADGQVVAVPCANLAAAKEWLAAARAAERRFAVARTSTTADAARVRCIRRSVASGTGELQAAG